MGGGYHVRTHPSKLTVACAEREGPDYNGDLIKKVQQSRFGTEIYKTFFSNPFPRSYPPGKAFHSSQTHSTHSNTPCPFLQKPRYWWWVGAQGAHTQLQHCHARGSAVSYWRPTSFQGAWMFDHDHDSLTTLFFTLAYPAVEKPKLILLDIMSARACSHRCAIFCGSSTWTIHSSIMDSK